ncbi:MAG: SRPBCC family protein [Actinomycetota bacterium]
MAFFRVTARIEAPPSRVWEVLRDWEGSAGWMVDATTVDVLSPQREGAGTRVRAITRIAGVALTDVMIVTRWEPPRLLEVQHVGWPIRGLAWFELAPDAGATRFEWAEELDPPLGPLGELGGTVLRAPIERMLRRSLVKLRAVCERS